MSVIKEMLITNNRPRRRLNPQGIVVHSTDNRGATAMNHHDYWNRQYRGSSANYVVDWDEIIRLIPDSEQSWHGGRTANSRYIGIEICEPKDGERDKFIKAWENAVWLVATLCIKYNWKTGPNVWSHNGITRKFRETTHTDPYGYFNRFGKSWAIFLKEVDNKIVELKSATAPRIYVVQRGDSLWKVAVNVYGRGKGMKYLQIKKLNGLSSNTIYAGQKLKY